MVVTKGKSRRVEETHDEKMYTYVCVFVCVYIYIYIYTRYSGIPGNL